MRWIGEGGHRSCQEKLKDHFINDIYECVTHDDYGIWAGKLWSYNLTL